MSPTQSFGGGLRCASSFAGRRSGGGEFHGLVAKAVFRVG
jgi:hypothetical protein